MRTSVKNNLLFLTVGVDTVVPPNKDRIALIISGPTGAFCRFNFAETSIGGNGIAIYDQDPPLVLTLEHFGSAIQQELRFTPSIDAVVNVMEFSIDRSANTDIVEFDDG